MKNVRITVRGEQLNYGERTVTQQEVSGTLEQTAQGFLLAYDEPEDSGLGKTRTTLAIEDTCVTLKRSGHVESVMMFSLQEKHLSQYRTMQGDIAMEITTKSLRSKLSERGGVLEICYAISMNGSDCGENRLKIRVMV